MKECVRCDMQLLEREVDEFLAALSIKAKDWLLTEINRELYSQRDELLRKVNNCICRFKHPPYED